MKKKPKSAQSAAPTGDKPSGSDAAGTRPASMRWALLVAGAILVVGVAVAATTGGTPAAPPTAPARGGPAPAAAVAAPVAAAPAASTDGRFTWAPSYEEGLAQAKKNRKHVLVDFYTDWCGWCKRLDSDVFSKDSFQVAAADIIGVKVNAEKLPALARKYGVSSYPRLFFLNPDGVPLEQVRGYLSLVDFTAKVKQVVSGDTEYERFRQAASDPKDVHAARRFARFLTDANLSDLSIPYWQQTHDLAVEQVFANPQNTTAATYHREALLELGKAYGAVGLHDVARQSYAEVVAAYPGTPQAQEASFSLAQIDLANGRQAQGLAALQALVREFPASQAGRQAAQLLNAQGAAAGRQVGQ